ncbi:MAG: hypothetical protein M3Q23_16805 [Actinomycetota bacterium]|nr:hypothetical protein [Actinomycetota bacterium]
MRRPVLCVSLLAVLTGCLAMAPPAPAPVGTPERPDTPPPGTTCSVFPSDSIWHADISKLPVDAHSSAWIDSMGGGSVHIHPDFGPSDDTDTGPPYGIPYNVVDGTHQKVSVKFLYASESDPGPYPFGPDITIEAGSDRHAIMVDKDSCTLYELFDATYKSSGSTAGSGAIWNLASDALRPAGWTSADAAGLPIFAGLVRLDEVNAGLVDHAIRVTASCTDTSYVWPARHQAGCRSDPNLPPMGARFRLKANVDISGFRPDTQAILQAMKTYGLILADNGSSWFFQGTAEHGWPTAMLDELKTIPASDFEAVDASSLEVDPNSGQAAAGPVPGATVTVSDAAFTPTPVTVKQGQAVLWNFTGSGPHSVTDPTGMGLFDSGTHTAGGSFSFTFLGAGTYPYRDSVSHFSGSVKVPIVVSPAKGTTSTAFAVTWASAALPAGFASDVQVMRPGSTTWTSWLTGQTATGGPFTPDAGAGTYRFRARVRNTANGKAGGYSPPAAVRVS